jgi:hypothetical protein
VDPVVERSRLRGGKNKDKKIHLLTPRSGPDKVDIPPVSAKGNPGPPQKVA